MRELSERLSPKDISMKSTGIPPLVSLLAKLRNLEGNADSILQCIEENREMCVKDLVKELELRALGTNTVTYHGLRQAIMETLEEAGVTSNEDRNLNLNQAPESQDVRPAVYLWGGRFRRVPQDFTFPECSIQQLWHFWLKGDEKKKIPPYRSLNGKDMPSRNLQKRLCDVRFLMKAIEKDLKDNDVQIPLKPTSNEVMETFEKGKGAISIASETPTQRKRRLEQIGWLTMVKIVRKKQKK